MLNVGVVCMKIYDEIERDGDTHTHTHTQREREREIGMMEEDGGSQEGKKHKPRVIYQIQKSV